MNKEVRKVILIGTGFVGMSMAFAFLQTSLIDELVLIDANKDKAEGESMDLNHGTPYGASKLKIKAGDYDDCKDADIIVICAGANQKPGQTRLDLTVINANIMKTIASQIKATGFQGIILVASNPVDIMTYVVQKEAGLPKNQVFGTGTILDTARLRYMMGEYLNVSSKDVHAYMMGEHGDSSFVSWVNCYIGCKSMIEYLEEKGKDLGELNKIYHDVQRAAYEIIERKQATYYGIGMSLQRIIQAIFHDEHTILTVSAYINGEYQNEGLYIGVPAVISRNGVEEIVSLPLNPVDQEKFNHSCNALKEIIETKLK